MDPDPTPFFSDFQMQKKKLFFPIFFSYINYPQALFSELKIIFCQNFVLKSYFASIISDKGRILSRIRINTGPDPGGLKHADPDPQHCL
jgi:hypothetical protein